MKIMTGRLQSLLLSIFLAFGCACASQGASPPAATAATSATPPDAASAAAGNGQSPPAPATATVYTCPMDPDVVSPVPGNCPKCGMKLRPRQPAP